MRQQFHVFGTVQGVGYRWYARHHALRLSLRGWVRNEPDGTVLAEAQGTPEALLEFYEALVRGPASAEVTEVRRHEQLEVPDAARHFEITH